jgi:hypothetical protein
VGDAIDSSGHARHALLFSFIPMMTKLHDACMHCLKVKSLHANVHKVRVTILSVSHRVHAT